MKNENSNQLLARLGGVDRRRFADASSEVSLVLGETLADAGDLIAHVYLPISGYVSLIRPIDGQQIEVGMSGQEGMFGWALALDTEVSEIRALVQGSGSALRMTRAAFRGQMQTSGALRHTVARYTAVLMTQMAQTAGCNRFHTVEKRLARWLLTTSDRARSPLFRVTQEFLGNMLGVRRAGVTQAAGRLQARGLIRYQRGQILIRDRQALEAASCSCYAVNAASYTRIMGGR